MTCTFSSCIGTGSQKYGALFQKCMHALCRRLEHSLGVGHLAYTLADSIYKMQREELDISRSDVKCAEIAGAGLSKAECQSCMQKCVQKNGPYSANCMAQILHRLQDQRKRDQIHAWLFCAAMPPHDSNFTLLQV